MLCKGNWISRCRTGKWCATLLLLGALLGSGCPPQRPSGTVYVPEVDRLYFVAPGDVITDANGLERARIPYKGIVMSNQRYLSLLEPTHE